MCEKFNFVYSLLLSKKDDPSIDSVFVLEIVILQVALVKKIVRSKNISKPNFEIKDLGFEAIDYEYLRDNKGG